jgi:hypothetical protein
MVDEAGLPDLTGALDEKHVFMPFAAADKPSHSGFERSRNV